MFMPLPLPMEVLSSMAPAVKLTEEDRQVRGRGAQLMRSGIIVAPFRTAVTVTNLCTPTHYQKITSAFGGPPKSQPPGLEPEPWSN